MSPQPAALVAAHRRSFRSATCCSRSGWSSGVMVTPTGSLPTTPMCRRFRSRQRRLAKKTRSPPTSMQTPQMARIGLCLSELQSRLKMATTRRFGLPSRHYLHRVLGARKSYLNPSPRLRLCQLASMQLQTGCGCCRRSVPRPKYWYLQHPPRLHIRPNRDRLPDQSLPVELPRFGGH